MDRIQYYAFSQKNKIPAIVFRVVLAAHHVARKIGTQPPQRGFASLSRPPNVARFRDSVTLKHGLFSSGKDDPVINLIFKVLSLRAIQSLLNTQSYL